jgi:hypothetical protein
MSILATATGLLDKLTFAISGFSNSFAVGDLGLTHTTLNFELAFHAIDDDLKVKLTHT